MLRILRNLPPANIKNMKRQLLICLLLLLAACTNAQKIPAETWKERIFDDHNEVLTRVYFNDQITVYTDKDVSKSVTWPYKLMTDAWTYTKKLYGPFGKDTRLYVILHGGNHGQMGVQRPYFDEEGEYRNVVDVSTYHWETDLEFGRPALIHEMGHIVEGGSNNVKGSPSFNIWKDSKWNDIFIYDVYSRIGMKDTADAWYNKLTQDVQDFPGKKTYWFRDWWFPIYDKYGKSAVLSNYFKLMSKNLPKRKHVMGEEYEVANLNMGEFIHFWSGAAGVNLVPLAAKAFGWTPEWAEQFKKAQQDYPKVKYSHPEKTASIDTSRINHNAGRSQGAVSSVAADSLILTTDNAVVFKANVKLYNEQNQLLATQNSDIKLPGMSILVIDGKEQEKGKYIYLKPGTALTLKSMKGGLECTTIKVD
jgi:hypothetical protein